LASAVGCGTPAPRVGEARITHDLAAELAVADIGTEIPRLRLADPAHRSRLGMGWGKVEEDASGPFVWAVGERSEVELFVARPRDLELVLHGRPFGAEGAPEQSITLSVEPPPSAGRRSPAVEVVSRVLDSGADRHRFLLPSSAFDYGTHRLILEPSQVFRPKDWLPGSEDDRPLTLQVYSLEILGAVDSEPPRRAAGEAVSGPESGATPAPDDPASPPDRLEIPVGAGATWFVIGEEGERVELRVSESSTADLRLTLDPIPMPPGLEGGRRLAEGAEVDPRAAGVSAEIHRVEPGQAFERPLPPGSLVRISAQAVARRPWWRPWASGPGQGRVQLTAFGLGAGGESEQAPAPSSSPPPATAASDPGSAATGNPTRPDILVYLVDTLRADRLGVYGYHRETSPSLDRFAADAVVFTEARAQTSWTRTAVVSLFTGLLPQSHGVNDREDALADAGITTLAEALWHSGYRTAGVVTNGNAGPRFGLAQGFEVYQHLMESRQRRDVHHLADRVSSWVQDWLEGLPAAEAGDPAPFFLYAHATDPHAPYTPHEPFRSWLAADVDPALGELGRVRKLASREELSLGTGSSDPEGVLRWPEIDPESARLGEQLGKLYDAEIAFWDHHFGLLMEDLKRRGLYQSMAILVLSDHGEEFFDNGGWEHGRTLYEEQLHIPFLLKLPGNRGGGRRVHELADQVDVLPTLLELAGVEIPEGIDGQSLLPAIARALDGEGDPGGRAAGPGGDAISSAYLGLGEHRQRSLVRGDLKWIGRDGHGEMLFQRLPRRFDEGWDRAAEQPWVAGWLRQQARRIELRAVSSGRMAEQADIDPELRKQLQALGYLP
ncbi:MAG: sulfatase, partial [Holophagales bacterium]|nr:sulfatase [Holophagales bacterium]